GVRAIDLRTRAITDVALAGPPTDVEIAPDGALAIAVLRAQNEIDFLPLPDALADPTKIAKLSTGAYTAGQVVITADGKSGLLLDNRVSGTLSVEAFDLASFVITSVALGSPPIAVGVVPGTAQVYVAQDHPLGRMTFVDEATFQTRTLTGFGLNGQIVE